MQLNKFRVQNFKRIEETDWIDVDDVTAFVGGNETGKTSILQALWKLKPGRENIKLDALNEFPRRRYTKDYVRGGEWPVVTAVFMIDPEVRAKLVEIDPAFERCEEVHCTSFYDHDPSIELVPEPKLGQLTSSDVKKLVERARKQIAGAEIDQSSIEPVAVQAVGEGDEPIETQKPPDEVVQEFRGAAEGVADQILQQIDKDAPGESLAGLLTSFRDQLTGLSQHEWQRDTWIGASQEIETRLARPSSQNQMKKARALVWSEVPVFVYFDDYNMLESKIVMPEAIQQIAAKSQDPKVRSQWALFELTGFNIGEITALAFSRSDPNQPLTDEVRQKLFQEVEKRGVHASAAARSITEEFQKWWHHQTQHNIEFHVDGETFRIEVSDKNYPVPIKFEERSKGFRWFFTFFLVFTAETEYEHKNAVLLLDEPGLHLYSPAQEELLRLFDELSEHNQVIYTTHSGFMVDGRHLERVRFLEEMDDGLIRVSPDASSVTGKTAMPVQAMVFYQTARLLFLARRVLVVEGETDHLFLQFVSEHLKEKGDTGLPEYMVIAHAGGARGVLPLVAMYAPQRFEIVVVLDSDTAGKSAGKRLEKAKFTELPAVELSYYGDILGKDDPFDLESILPQDQYIASIEQSHGVKLPKIKPTKNETLSVAVKQWFGNQGLEFDKGKAMQWLVDDWRKNGVPEIVEEQTTKVFQTIRDAIDGMTEKEPASPLPDPPPPSKAVKGTIKGNNKE
ncbi:MAG: AAA family ATPase [Chloroflexi bacterium]|nr:AAA family ATPase [Chloroflexota bacterium]